MEHIRQQSELRALSLLVELPNLSDEDIALLMHDELVNMRCTTQAYFQWATPETVGRVRRTALLAIHRQQG